MNVRKTQRKNKTKQVISWPSNDMYFTIDSLIKSNQHILTTSGSDITLRVRLNKAITEEPYQVAVIGQKNCGKGRPQLVFAMRPVSQSVINKAKSDGIMMIESSKLIPIMEVTPVVQFPLLASPKTTTITNISDISKKNTVNV